MVPDGPEDARLAAAPQKAAGIRAMAARRQNQLHV